MAVPPTLLSLLPEGHHLVELPLYQPVSLPLIQPFATRERLLYPREWTVHHHLCNNIFSNIHPQGITGGRACSPYLFTVPASADSVVVVADGHSAEGTEERSDLNVKDVR